MSTTQTINGLLLALERDINNKELKLVLSDAYEDIGDLTKAYAWRWIVGSARKPCEFDVYYHPRDNYPFCWFFVSEYQFNMLTILEFYVPLYLILYSKVPKIRGITQKRAEYQHRHEAYFDLANMFAKAYKDGWRPNI